MWPLYLFHVTLHLALQAPYHSPSKPILATPSRYPRTNQSYNWSTCNGTPDAVCFSVNQSSVQIAGICVYTGLGQYNYELELLDGVRKYSHSFLILFNVIYIISIYIVYWRWMLSNSNLNLHLYYKHVYFFLFFLVSQLFIISFYYYTYYHFAYRDRKLYTTTIKYGHKTTFVIGTERLTESLLPIIFKSAKWSQFTKPKINIYFVSHSCVLHLTTSGIDWKVI